VNQSLVHGAALYATTSPGMAVVMAAAQAGRYSESRVKQRQNKGE
jgi:hypothetical protein